MERQAMLALREAFVSLRSDFEAIARRGVECKAWRVEDRHGDFESIVERCSGPPEWLNRAICDCVTLKYRRVCRTQIQEGWRSIEAFAADAGRLSGQLSDSLWDRLWSENGFTIPEWGREGNDPWLWFEAVFALALQAVEGSPLWACPIQDCDIHPTMDRPLNPKVPVGAAEIDLTEFDPDGHASWYAFLPNFAAASVSAINILVGWIGAQDGHEQPLSITPTPPNPESERWPPDHGWHFRTREAAFLGVSFEISGKPFEALKALAHARRGQTIHEIGSTVSPETQPVPSTIRGYLSEVRTRLREVFRVDRSSEKNAPIVLKGKGDDALWSLAPKTISVPAQNQR